jgi:hypothetical protein
MASSYTESIEIIISIDWNYARPAGMMLPIPRGEPVNASFRSF